MGIRTGPSHLRGISAGGPIGGLITPNSTIPDAAAPVPGEGKRPAREGENQRGPTSARFSGRVPAFDSRRRPMSALSPSLTWLENAQPQTALWRSEAGLPAPKKVVVADDSLGADAAFRLASEGSALLWRGDFQNARQLLAALARRCDKRRLKPGGSAAERFHLHRQAQAQRARTLGMLLIPLAADFSIPLRRAPDLQLACSEVWPAGDTPSVVSLRELLGLIGAHEWRKKGVHIGALSTRIHPHYGVFSPVRGEYVDLVAQAPLPTNELAFEIGVGSGVLALLLARRGVKKIIATDCDPRALACARDNVQRLKLGKQVKIIEADMFPEGRAALVLCNPPWLPGRPATPIENAIYDPDSRMLKAFLDGLAGHLEPNGEGWLILSDLAEHLGLRRRETLLEWIAAAGLRVIDRSDIKPRHPKAGDPDDPLYAARSAELTSLWRLAAVAEIPLA